MQFEETLREIAGVTEDESIKMRSWMIKHELAKQDFCLGRISVQHGAYLEGRKARGQAGGPAHNAGGFRGNRGARRGLSAPRQ